LSNKFFHASNLYAAFHERVNCADQDKLRPC